MPWQARSPWPLSLEHLCHIGWTWSSKPSVLRCHPSVHILELLLEWCLYYLFISVAYLLKRSWWGGSSSEMDWPFCFGACGKAVHYSREVTEEVEEWTGGPTISFKEIHTLTWRPNTMPHLKVHPKKMPKPRTRLLMTSQWAFQGPFQIQINTHSCTNKHNSCSPYIPIYINTVYAISMLVCRDCNQS